MPQHRQADQPRYHNGHVADTRELLQHHQHPRGRTGPLTPLAVSVVPKSMRQALGLKTGQSVEIRAGDGRLEIEIAPTPMRLKKRGKGIVAVPDAPLPSLTAEQVRVRWNVCGVEGGRH